MENDDLQKWFVVMVLERKYKKISMNYLLTVNYHQ